MITIYMLGDVKTETGPAIANKQIRETLNEKYKIKTSNQGNYLLRIIDCIINTVVSDYILICSKSMINYISIKIAKILRKKVYYIMHGIASVEAQINQSIHINNIKQLIAYEKYVLSNVTKVIAVSNYEKEYLCRLYPYYATKIDYVYNRINVNYSTKRILKKNTIVSNCIASIGGDMPRKKNDVVAKAIDLMEDKHIRYKVIGSLSFGKKKCLERNIEWIGSISHSEVIDILSDSFLYIQNSEFETFGMAVIEALMCGCSILISKNVGCKDLFMDLQQNDVINDCNNVSEICEKIKFLLENPNHDRLITSFREEYVTKQWLLDKFTRIFKEQG